MTLYVRTGLVHWRPVKNSVFDGDEQKAEREAHRRTRNAALKDDKSHSCAISKNRPAHKVVRGRESPHLGLVKYER